jgi:hypothetical protein
MHELVRISYRTDYDKIQRFISRCPTIVKAEYAQQLAVSNTNELRLSWDSFQPVLTTAWDAAFKKQQLYSELGLSQEQNSNRRQHQHQDTGSQRPPSSDSQNDKKDITISCSECAETFLFPVKTQTDFETKGYVQPRRCTKCRNPDKICDAFATTGSCRFGDSCKFKHQADNATNETTVRHRLAALVRGQYQTACKHFAANICENGDACHYTHPGRESAQKAEAARIRTAAVDQVPTTGFAGLNKRQ